LLPIRGKGTKEMDWPVMRAGLHDKACLQNAPVNRKKAKKKKDAWAPV